MKNKILKNLIVLGAFVFFVVSANNAFAYGEYMPFGYNYSGASYNTSYVDYSNLNSNPYNMVNPTQQPVNQIQYVPAQQTVQYVQQPSTQIQYVPAQQTVQYVQQPATRIEYVPAQKTIQYVQQPATKIEYIPAQQAVRTVNTTSTQGASVLGSTSNNNKVIVSKNTGATPNTGQYVSYDYNQNAMLASAYGSYNNQQQPNMYYDNGVTALSVKGSGSFMPSSVFQWFMLILLIIGIVIVARMISRSYRKDSNNGVPAH